jgi:putative MATE family efflux protein
MASISAQRALPAETLTRRRVFSLALPAVFEQLLNTLVGLADVYLVGNLSLVAATALGYTGAIALNATGLGNQFTWLVMVMFMAVGIGSTALTARAIGARDTPILDRIVRQSIVLAVIVGLVGLIGGLLFAEPFLRLLGTPADVLPLAVDYVHLNALAFFPTAILLVGMAMLRGAGDTRTPLYVMLGINIVNILITWLLVNGQFGLPALGVNGAAIGTAMARGGGGIVILWLLLRGHSGLRLSWDRRPDGETLRRLVRVGLPTAGEQLLFQGALLIFIRFVNGLGTAAYAAHTVTISIESLSFLPGLGYAAATSALVGQALGARDPQRAEAYAYEALFQAGLMMALIGSIMVLFPQALTAIFVNDPAVIAAAAAPLRAAGLVQPALAVSFVILGALRGAGDTRWPLYSRMLTTWAVRLPLAIALVLYLDLGLAGIWLAMCTDFTLQAILSLYRFSSGRWKRIEV